jgi:hypothetical protein
VHSLRGEREFAGIQLALFEKLIQKSTAVALAIAVARNESRDSACVLDGDLNELPIFQERVHAGKALGSGQVAGRILAPREGNQ